MKTWTDSIALAALAATLTLAGCTEDGPGSMIEADAPEEAKTHLTAAELSESLAAGQMPNIDWVTWYDDGLSPEVFPLELRTTEEVQAEREAKGRRLPGGGYMPPGTVAVSPAEADMWLAQQLIIRQLQPRPECPFYPCRFSSQLEERLERDAERLNLPYSRPPESMWPVEGIR